MTVTLSYDGELDRFIVNGEDRARLPTILTEIAGARFRKQAQVWHVPATWQHAKLLRRYVGKELYLDDSAQLWVEKFNDFADSYEDAKAGDFKRLGPWFEGLFDHQETAIEAMAQTLTWQHWFLLLDDMGLGKTVEAMRAVALADQRGESMYPVLAVTKASLKFQLAGEHPKWSEGECIVIHGSAAVRKRQIQQAKDFIDQGVKVTVIMNHESVRLHSKLARFHGLQNTPAENEHKELNDIEWGTVLIDEAHKVISPKAKQTRALRQMGQQARNRIAMTGTPIRETPGDLWTLLHFCDPDQFPARSGFISEWVVSAPGFFGGMQTFGLKTTRRDDFFEWFDLCHLRRTKKEVLSSLPEKMPPVFRRVALSKEQKKFYDDLVKFNLSHAFVDNNYEEDLNEVVTEEDQVLALASMDALDRHRLLRIAASGLPVVNDDGQVVAVHGPSSKFDELCDIITEGGTGAGSNPLVVFTTHRRVLRMLERQFAELKEPALRVGAIHGKVAPKARQAIVDRFQEGGLDILLATLATGAEGVTLTRSNHVVLFEPTGSHIINKQAEDRIHRIGQTRACQITYLIGEGTVEEGLINSADVKGFYSEQILRDKERMQGIGPDSVYARYTS